MRRRPTIVHLRPGQATRTANKGCVWIAATEIDDRRFVARSRYGAANELARQLLAAGIPDGPMIVRTTGLRGEMTIRSFHEAARFTYEESASKPVHMVRWRDPANETAQITARKGQKEGVNVLAASATSPDAVSL